MEKVISTTSSKSRFLWAVTVIIAFFCSSIITVTSPQSASAADLTQFDAGEIISDSVFYNGASMSANDIQNFLNARVPSCTINNGQPSHAAGAPYGNTSIADVCLKDYRQSTPTMSAQPGLCAQYQGSPSESAAQIISKVSIACNISPKVLLVLINKEQSLVTDSWPTIYQYTHATGFACYDNGQPCVSDYDGFFYQVWAAARQFQRYGQAPFTWYPVGAVSNILYQANKPECGTKAVYIKNRATAALYYYTPYTPNQAALSAGYGTGDACSAYGNRNFYQFFVDWFGSTRGNDVDPSYLDTYTNFVNNSGALGTPSSTKACGYRDNGCFQRFTGGFIVSSNASGTHVILNNMLNYWWAVGGENGVYGWPTSNPINSSGSNYTQDFEGGTITWANGTGTIPSEMSPWVSARADNPWLGARVNSRTCGYFDSGCAQQFTNGYLVSSAGSGLFTIKASLIPFWWAQGGEGGSMGWPTSNPSSTTSNSYTQSFQGGLVTVTNGNAVFTSNSDPWLTAIRNNSWLGISKGTKICSYANSGCAQLFTNGYIVSSANTPISTIRLSLVPYWWSLGGENGTLGWPNGDPSSTTSSTYTQSFQGGTISVTNGVPRVINPSDPWTVAETSNSWLGISKGSKICGYANSGCAQLFTNGYIVSSATTPITTIKSSLVSFWWSLGGEGGVLGWPNGDPSSTTSNTYTQSFQGGTVSVNNGKPTVVFNDAAWQSRVNANTWLGTPTGQKLCIYANSGCAQLFSNGYLVSSATSGIVGISSTLVPYWWSLGGEGGAMGWPTSDPSSTSGNTYIQSFQGGSISVTNGVPRRN